MRHYRASFHHQNSKRRAKQLRKYKRAASGWKQHTDYIYSNLIMTDFAALWLEMFGQGAIVEFKLVDNHQQYPDFRKGTWDGKAFFVTFKGRNDAHEFKALMWRHRGS